MLLRPQRLAALVCTQAQCRRWDIRVAGTVTSESRPTSKVLPLSATVPTVLFKFLSPRPGARDYTNITSHYTMIRAGGRRQCPRRRVRPRRPRRHAATQRAAARSETMISSRVMIHAVPPVRVSTVTESVARPAAAAAVTVTRRPSPPIRPRESRRSLSLSVTVSAGRRSEPPGPVTAPAQSGCRRPVRGG